MKSASRTGLEPAALVRELLLTAFVTVLLCVPIVSLQATDSPSGLVLVGRWTETIAVILLVLLGRTGLILLDHQLTIRACLIASIMVLVGALLPQPSSALGILGIAGGLVLLVRAAWYTFREDIRYRLFGPSASDSGGKTPDAADRNRARRIQVLLTGLVVVFALLMPHLPFSSRYLVDIATLILTYVMLGWGLNIIVGYAGLLDLGYVAFYAVGAYSYALLATHLGLGFWACLPLAGILAAMFGLLLGFPVLRLRGDYFAIVTLGFGEIIRIVLINWYSLTNGPDGISGIPRPDLFGFAVFSRKEVDGVVPFHQMFDLGYSTEHRIIFLYYLILALTMLVALFTLRIRNLPIGRAWEALREDEIACASLGIDRKKIKLAAFAISAMWGGLAGSFFATRQGFISPESFTFLESAIILAIVVLGGMGNLTGIAIAAALLIGLPEVFRELADYRMVTFGGGLVLIMLWRPGGLISHREPSVRLYGHSNTGPPPQPGQKTERPA